MTAVSRENAPPKRASRVLVLAAWVYVLVTMFAWLGTLPLLEPDEGRNASVAAEMASSGAWLVPTYDGNPYLDKPAFYFRAVALAFDAFGRSEFSARLPSALAGLATLLLVFWFVRLHHGLRTAAVAIVVIQSTPMFFGLERVVIMDMQLALFVCASILTGFEAEYGQPTPRRGLFVTSAVCTGLATLVKGPVGFLVPGFVLVALALIERRKGALRRLFAPLHIALFFAVTLPWFVSLCLARPDFLYYGLVYESWQRFSTGLSHHRESWWFYAPILFVGGMGWSLLVPEGLFRAWRARAELFRADRLLVVWGITVSVFFSLSSSKLPAYVLTAFVAAGIGIARLIDAGWRDPQGAAAGIVRRGTGMLTLLLAIVFAVGLAGLLRPDAAAHLVARAVPDLQDLDLVHGVLLALTIGVGVLVAMGAFAWVRRRTDAAFLVHALALPILGWSVLPILRASLGERRTARSLATAIRELDADVDVVALAAWSSGLPFYLGRNVTLVTSDGVQTRSNYLVYTLARAQDWPATMVETNAFVDWLDARPRPVLLIAPTADRDRVEAQARRRGLEPIQLTSSWCGVVVPARGGR